jgi:glycosyltransferase involved in cell wall biosynthesis
MDGLSFLAHMLPQDGYGYAGIKIAEALQELSHDVTVTDMQVNGRLPQMSQGRQWEVDGAGVAMCVPEWWPSIKANQLVGYTMFETTHMPDERVSLINELTDMCLVPCPWCAEMFANQGVRVPIHVVPWGIDTNDYFPLPRSREEGQPYTFLWSGTGDFRKGWDVAYKAFMSAFGSSDSRVRLLLHFRSMPLGVMGFRDSNVDVVVGYFDRPQLREMLQGADCFVFPSRGEGWGLPPREAAATGLPVIATNWGGLAHEIDNWAIPLEVSRLSSASFAHWQHGEVGDWADPDWEKLTDLMRWCFENQEVAANFGKRSADWLAQHTSWTRTARGILEWESYAN